MEKTLVTILVTFALILGVIGGSVFTPSTIETKEVIKEVPVNVSVEKIVEVPAPSILDKAVSIFLQSVEDEEDEAGNDIDVLGTYDFDEIEVSKVYNEWSVSYDDEITTIEFSIKLRFDEEGEASEKETYDVTVIIEEDEDTIVIVD